MKNVLIPTNFSEQSRFTLNYVLDILRDSQVAARILLLNTYTVQQTGDSSELVKLNDLLKMQSKARLSDEVEWAKTYCKNPNLTIESTCHLGTLNNVILNLLRKEKIDLVAMGKGSGNHVEQVTSLLKYQKCPLLIT